MLSAQQYAEQALALYAPHANPDNAAPMQQYMKQIAPFLGIKTPLRRQLAKQFWQTYSIPPIEQVPDVVRALYSMPYRELHYLAIELVEYYAKKWQPKDLDLLEYIITTHSWWDSVDAVRKTVGALLLRHPQLQEPATRRWLASGNQWLQRMSLIFQLGYKKTLTSICCTTISYHSPIQKRSLSKKPSVGYCANMPVPTRQRCAAL